MMLFTASGIKSPRATASAEGAFDSGRRPWELGLPAMRREAVPKPDALVVTGVLGLQVLLPLRARSQANGTPPGQLPRPPARIKIKRATRSASAEGVGADLSAMGREAVLKPCDAVAPGVPRSQVLLPLRARSQASQLPRPPARIKGLPAKTPGSAECAFDSGRRPWELGLPAMGREAVPKPDALVVTGVLGLQVLLPLRARSQANGTPPGQLPRPPARIKIKRATRSASAEGVGADLSAMGREAV
ncbi:hypothetical protein ABQX22_21210, partial [Xanthomonas sp. WHRI 1810A]|uniref:hypothetical protein n=1 Tax=Xanthomonas sp. WHRI 1810A TaxID=3161565 RepID=UPI0032E86357